MSAIIQSRRSFIAGLGALFVAAPAIVRAASIMPVKALAGAEFEFSGFYSLFILESTPRGHDHWFKKLFLNGIQIVPDGTFSVPSGVHRSSIEEWVTPIDLPQDIT